MEFTNKAIINKKKRIKEIVAIILLGCVGSVAFIFTIANLFKLKFIFALIYAVACLFSVVYTIIKINAVIPTFIANDEENLYMRYWDNGFFPFRTDKGFLGEFMPEKVKSSKIAIRGIESICIGSGKFVSRAFPESEFAEKMKEYKDKHSMILKRMEFMHITLKSGKEKYMSVSDFDTECLANIVKDAKRGNNNIYFTTGNRDIRKIVSSEDNLTERN